MVKSSPLDLFLVKTITSTVHCDLMRVARIATWRHYFSYLFDLFPVIDGPTQSAPTAGWIGVPFADTGKVSGQMRESKPLVDIDKLISFNSWDGYLNMSTVLRFTLLLKNSFDLVSSHIPRVCGSTSIRLKKALYRGSASLSAIGVYGVRHCFAKATPIWVFCTPYFQIPLKSRKHSTHICILILSWAQWENLTYLTPPPATPRERVTKDQNFDWFSSSSWVASGYSTPARRLRVTFLV
jgi:hypothetical protein